jgi:CMP-N,N'-diacetyllegionaminic acid synthase
MSGLNCIILARGGSKTVPGKNIKKINGVPLLAYPIIAAQGVKKISNIYVSTDDKDIADIALKYGALIIDRPKALCEDQSLDIEAMRHAVSALKNNSDIVHLRATTPMIDSGVLSKAINIFISHPSCSSLRSAHESPESAYKFFKRKGSYWSGLFDDELEGEYYNLPRQSLPPTYSPNGYIDIIRPSQFMKNNSLHGNKILSFITDFAYEVDTMDDLNTLRAVYGKN